MSKDMPEIVLDQTNLTDGSIRLVKLISAAGMASSSSEARRLIQSGAVSIDSEKLTDVMGEITPTDGQVLRVGKLKFAKLRVF